MGLISFKRKYVDGKLILLLAAFYTLFYIIFIIKIAYLRTYVMEEEKFSLLYIIINGYLIDWIIVVSFMSLIAVSTKRLIVKKVSWKKIFFLHLVLSIFIGVIIRVIVVLYYLLRGEISWSEITLKRNLTSFMEVLDLNFLIYFAMIFIIYVYYYINQIREVEEKKGLLETQLVNTRMKMLTAQLQPHFLFNTLNSITSLIEIDTKRAKDTIADLSDFLREILYNGEAKFISLEKELTVLGYYLNIVEVRFGDHLSVEQDIDPKLLPQQIPAMLLQPIVENSVKHGYSYDHTDLHIKIAIFKKKDWMYIKIENNGQLLAADSDDCINKGVGLSNLKERLVNLYGNENCISIKNKTDGTGVKTLIQIPLKN